MVLVTFGGFGCQKKKKVFARTSLREESLYPDHEISKKLEIFGARLIKTKTLHKPRFSLKYVNDNDQKQ